MCTLNLEFKISTSKLGTYKFMNLKFMKKCLIPELRLPMQDMGLTQKF